MRNEARRDTLKFAAFTTVAASAGESTNSADMLDNLRQQTVLAEELGYEAMWLGEHHFGPYGVGDLPNPILLGADLAARTSRIRIGQMANIAPWWHPIRLAEDLSILDNMTRGRIDVGFGRGIWPYEGPQFHPNADPRKDRENRELFREMWRMSGRYGHQVLFHSVRITPSVKTRFLPPLPPTRMAMAKCNRPAGHPAYRTRILPCGYVSTDQLGLHRRRKWMKACYWQPPPARIRQRMELYAELRSKIEGRPFAIGEDQAVMRSTYVASSMEDARRDAEAGIMSSFAFNDPFRGRQVFTNPGEELDPEAKLDWDFLEPRTLLVGSPDNVIERIQELQEVCNLDYLLVEFTHPGLSLRKTLRNLEIFATRVIPAFT